MTSPLSSAMRTDAVLDAARRADLRRRQRVARREGLAALVVALGVLSAFALLRLVVPLPPPVWWVASAVALVAPATALWRAQRRQPDLLAAAAALDGAAGLHDTLTTAAWFVERPPAPSAWIEAQHERAVAAAAALDVDQLCPIDPPRRLVHAAAGLALLLVAALLVPASWSRAVIGLDPTPATQTDGTPDAPGDETAADETDAAQMSTEELLAAAEQGLRTGGDTPSFDADETETGTSTGASTDTGERTAEGELPDVAGTGPAPADAERGDLDETRGEPASGESLQEALDRAADEAREAAEAAQAEAEGESDAGSEQDGNDDPGDEGGAGAGGGEGGAGTPTEDEAAGAMAGGHMSGPGEGEAADGLTLDAARAELEVTLKREQLASRFTALDASDEQLVERQSESGTSQLGFQNTAPAASYQGAGTDAVRPVPWAYQELVRTYFLERARQQRKDPR